MAEEGKEASGSMGDDTPVAVLSSHLDQYHIILDKILVKSPTLQSILPRK